MCELYERLTQARPHGSSAIHFFFSNDVPMDDGDGTMIHCEGGGGGSDISFRFFMCI